MMLLRFYMGCRTISSRRSEFEKKSCDISSFFVAELAFLTSFAMNRDLNREGIKR
jgi:hypothetical protein